MFSGRKADTRLTAGALVLALAGVLVFGAAYAYARSQTVVMLTRGDLRRMVLGRPAVARLAAWRQPAKEWMRRRGILR